MWDIPLRTAKSQRRTAQRRLMASRGLANVRLGRTRRFVLAYRRLDHAKTVVTMQSWYFSRLRNLQKCRVNTIGRIACSEHAFAMQLLSEQTLVLTKQHATGEGDDRKDLVTSLPQPCVGTKHPRQCCAPGKTVAWVCLVGRVACCPCRSLTFVMFGFGCWMCVVRYSVRAL